MVRSLYNKLRDEFGFIKGNMLVLIVGYTLFRISYSMHSSFRSLYIRELGASPLLLGLMGSIGSLLMALIRIPGSHIADKYGRRNILAIFTYGAAISYLFYVFAPDWRLILIGVIVSNLSHIYGPALEAIEADSMPPEKRGLGYSAINVLPSLPALVAAPIAGLIVERLGLIYGMRIIYGIIFLLVLLVAILRSQFLEETMNDLNEFEINQLGTAFKDSFKSISEAWRFQSKEVFYYTLVVLLSSFEIPLFHTYMALYANDIVGVSGFQWSLMDTVWIITMLFVGIPFGKVIDLMGRKKSILIGYFFSTPVIVFFIFSRSFLQLLIVTIFFSVGQAIMFPALAALRADLIPKERRGRMMGMIGFFRILALVPSETIFGFLYQVEPSMPYIVGIVLELFTISIIIVLIDEPNVR